MAKNPKYYSLLNEEVLVSLAKAGDTLASEELVSRLYSLVYFAASKYSFLGMEKADLIQEGMIGLLNALRTFDPASNVKFKTYANSCVYNYLNTVARRLYQKKQIPQEKLIRIDRDFMRVDVSSDPESVYIERESYDEMTAALRKKLSAREFEILKKYLSGYSAAEIADAIGINVKSVSNALYRIRQKFHSIIK